jgi:hypothetical protein
MDFTASGTCIIVLDILVFMHDRCGASYFAYVFKAFGLGIFVIGDVDVFSWKGSSIYETPTIFIPTGERTCMTQNMYT